ncbi:uncharacterized protein LOC117145090 [Drosophila mauritiana]|uniref:Uncharacterized protein LOC117145090 n=1 Tax=Drosophila mauritiana TaxID=7226 RepID=A0A6P8KRB5_DROMA|nr:uncharacterized protein LOC117145090 [Drosophila mauritiana]
MMRRETWSPVETYPHPGQVLGFIGQRPFDAQQCGSDDDTDPLIVGQAKTRAITLATSPGQAQVRKARAVEMGLTSSPLEAVKGDGADHRLSHQTGQKEDWKLPAGIKVSSFG